MNFISHLKPNHSLIRFSFLLYALIASFFASSQTIEIDNSNFKVGPYGRGGNITVPIKVDGCFGQNNKFELYLSDAAGNFPGVKIGEFNSFFAPFVNGQIPTGATASNGYKLQVRSTNPVRTSNSSTAFTIGNAVASAIKNPVTVPNLINDSIIGRCSYTSADDYNLYVTNEMSGTFEPKLLSSTGANVALTSLTPNDIQIKAQSGNYYTLQYAIKGNNNQYSIRSFLVLATTTNLSLQTSGSNEICLPDRKVYTVNTSDNGGIKLNYPGTVYTFSFGDGSPNESYTHCQLIENGGEVVHKYTQTSCSQPPVPISATETQYNAFKVNVTATNPFCNNFTPITTFAKVFEKPLASFDRPDYGCVNTDITFTNNSSSGQSAPGNAQNCTNTATYQWFVNGVPRSNDQNLVYKFTSPGTYSIRLVTNNGSCSDDTTRTICIEPTPVPDFLMNNKTDLSGCTPLTVNITNKTNSNGCRAFTWNWEVLHSATLASAVLGTEYTITPNATASEPVIKFLMPGVYIIRLTISNSCGTFTKDRVVTLKLDSEVTLPGNQRYCGLKTINFANTSGHIPTYNTNVGNESYQWTVTPATYSFVGGTSATSRTPQIQFNAFGVYTVKVKFTNDCNSDETSQTITFDEPITVNAGADQTVCFNETSTSLIASTSGTVTAGQWTTSGSGAFGNNNNLSTTYTFSSADKSLSSVTLTYTATPASGSVCLPVSDSRIVTIRPENKMTNAANSSICSGSAFTYTPASSQSGSTFNWTSTVSTGSVTGHVASGSGNINHTLVNSSTTTTAVVTYTITPVKDGCNGTPSTFTVTVTPKPAIAAAIGTNPNQCATATGSIALSGLAANQAYTVTYTFNGTVQTPVTLTANASGVATLSNLVAGTYSTIYVTLNNCPSAAVGPVTLIDPNPPAAPTANSNTPICSGGTLQLEAASTTAGVSYSWTGPNSWTSTSQNPTINSITTAQKGTYTVVTKLNNCTSLPATVTVVVNETPSAPTVSIPPVCEGSTLALSANSTGTGSITYAWTGPNGFTSSLQNPTIPNATTAANGTYSVVATATTGSCASTASSATVNIKPTPVISNATAVDPSSCASSTGSIKLNGLTAGVSYTVSYLKNGASQSVNLAADASGVVTISALSAGTYSDITVTSSGCLSNKVGPLVLKDPTPPAEPTISTNSPVCAGGTLELRASSTTAGVSYSWSGPGGYTSNSQNPDRSNITTADAGTYTVTVSLLNCTSSKNVTVAINPAPAMPVATSPVSYCLNATATPLTATATAGHTLRWYTSASGGIGEATAPTPSTTTATTLRYYVSQVATASGCESPRREIQVVIDPAIANNTISSDQTLCAGASAAAIGQASGSVNGGNGVYSYQWQQSINNGTTWSNISAATSASYSPGVPATTTKYRRVVTSNQCTHTSNEVTISVQGNLANIDISKSQTICESTTPEELTGAAPSGGTGTFTYQWYSSTDNSIWNAIASATAANYQPGVLSTTTHYRRKTTSGSCEAYSAHITITVNPKPVITPIADKTFCPDASTGSIGFTSTPGSNVTYAWTNDNAAIGLAASGNGSIASFTAQNASVPKVPVKGTITVVPTYTNNSVGCAGPAMSFNITVLPKITIEPIGNEVVCTGSSIAAVTPVHDAGSQPGSTISYKWTVTGQGVTLSSGTGNQIPAYTTLNTGASDLVSTIVVTPVYTYNGQSCDGVSRTYTVTVKSATPNASAGADRIVCAISDITMQATAAAGATGAWKQIGASDAMIVTPGSPTTTITGLVPNRTYEFEWTVSGFASCPSTKDTVVIINRPLPTVAIAGNDVELCSYDNAPLAVQLNGTVPQHAWETGAWQIESNTTGVSPVFSNAGDPASRITNIGLGNGINTGLIKLTWKISNDGGCTPSVDTAVIYVYRKPSAGVLSPNNAVCQNSSVNVTLNNHQGRIIKWRIKRAPFNDNDFKDSLITNTAVLFNNLTDSIQVQVIVGSVKPECNLFDTAYLLIPVHLPSLGGTTQGDAVYCIGSATGNVTLTGYRGTIVWEQSTNNGSSWTPVSGQSTPTLSYTNLSTTTWYRTKVQNGVCAPEFSAETKITVVPSTGAANAGPDQTICNGDSTLLTGNTVAGVTYTWRQISGVTLTTSATDKNSLWIYGMKPGQTYSFEYLISNGTCPPAKDTILILNAEPVVNTINARTETVCVGTPFTTLSPAATGGNNTAPVYQWQSSTNGTSFSDISGATAQSYSFTANTTTWLIRKATIGPCITISDTIQVKVIPNPDAATAGADLSLCFVETAQLKGNSTTTGVISWRKLSATAAIIEDANAAETKISNLLPTGSLPVKHEFEYAIDNGICPARKDTVAVIVYPQLINTITPLKDTICNSQPVTLGTAELKGGNGTYTYQWQQSVDGINFTNLTGKTDATLTFVPSQSLYLRRVVTSLPCTVYSDTAHVVVQAAIDNNQIQASADVCINAAPATIKGSVPTGGNGNFNYTWERSTDNGNTWTKIAGATSQDYTSGPLTVDTRFRRIVATDLCAGPQASTSNVVVMTVRPDAKAVFNPNPTIACPPFHITSAVVGLRTFPDQNKQYEWYADGNLIGTGVTFPGHTLATDGDSVLIKLKAISLYGCLNDSISHYLYSQPLPKPAFDMSTAEGCGPLDVKFTNNTPRPDAFTYKWDFGNGQTSTLAQPGTIVFQPNPTYGDTTYKISLTVFSICDTVSIEKSVRLKSKPKALFTPSKTIGCSPMTVEFTNTSLGIGNTYKWDFGDGTIVTASQKEPISHTFITAERDTFYVKLIASNECGDDIQEYAIVVTPNTIRLDFAVNGNEHLGCAPHPVRFINNTIGATSFRWDFGDGNIRSTTKNIDTVTHAYLTPGTYIVKLLATNGCSDTSTTESITVFSKPVSAFSANKYTVCIGDKVQFTNGSADATSYLWKFGDGEVSTVVNPSHQYKQAGTYNVVLITYKTSAPGVVCTDSVVQKVQVLSTMPGTFDATSLVGKCVPFTVTFTNRQQPSVLTTWDFGDGTTATGDLVTHTFTKPGSYTVSLAATVPAGCTYIASNTVQVNGPYGELKYKGGIVCNDQPTRFEATIVNTDNLVWDFGDGTKLTTTDRVVFHTYAHAGKYVPTVTLLSNTGCSYPIKGIDTLYVDKIKAGFQYTEDKVCGTTTLHFRDTSHVYSAKKSIAWDFGDGTTATGANPSHTYTASGNYTVQMTITGNSGCVETVTRQLNVAVYDKPVVDIVVNTKPCTNHTIEFVANIAAIDPINHIQWTLSNGVKGTGTPFKTVFNTPGTYSIQVIVGTVNGCFDTASTTFRVDPSPVITASNDVVLCRGGSTNLAVTGAAQYMWSPLEGLSCTTCPNPKASPLTTTPYVVTGTNSFGCTDQDTVVVTVMQPFKMNVSANDSICIGGSSLLQASGASTYRWSPATGLSSTTISNPVATPSVTTTYRVVGYDGANCFTDTAYVVVAVGEYPMVNLGPDLVLSTGTLQPLTSVVQNGPIRKWEWHPSTELSCDDCPLPVAHIKKDITYTVKVTTPYGCSDTDTLSIKTFCESAQVFVPNAFTPDGDGINDIAMVRGKGIVTVKNFRIFNRWGEVVFERSNFPPNQARYGWDGKVNGIIGGPDVFVFTADVICENGTTYTYKGNLSIIK